MKMKNPEATPCEPGSSGVFVLQDGEDLAPATRKEYRVLQVGTNRFQIMTIRNRETKGTLFSNESSAETVCTGLNKIVSFVEKELRQDAVECIKWLIGR
jgi:hypothetical protein